MGSHEKKRAKKRQKIMRLLRNGLEVTGFEY